MSRYTTRVHTLRVSVFRSNFLLIVVHKSLHEYIRYKFYQPLQAVGFFVVLGFAHSLDYIVLKVVLIFRHFQLLQQT